MRWIVWWFALLSAYVIEFVTQVASEVVAGILIAALCTAIVAVALRNGEPGVRVYWRWLRYLARVPAGMARDVAVVSARVIWAAIPPIKNIALLSGARMPLPPSTSSSRRSVES